jgi:hypothetical protein
MHFEHQRKSGEEGYLWPITDKMWHAYQAAYYDILQVQIENALNDADHQNFWEMTSFTPEERTIIVDRFRGKPN